MAVILYASQTGFTKRYAQWLSEETGLPCYPVEEAKGTVPKGEEVLFCTWLCARKMQALKEVKHYQVKAILVVCMNTPSPAIAGALRKEHKLPETLPVFMAQGGMDRSKLGTKHKMMLTAMTRVLEKVRHPSDEDKAMLDLLLYGGDWTNREQLEPMLRWFDRTYPGQRKAADPETAE